MYCSKIFSTRKRFSGSYFLRDAINRILSKYFTAAWGSLRSVMVDICCWCFQVMVVGVSLVLFWIAPLPCSLGSILYNFAPQLWSHDYNEFNLVTWFVVASQFHDTNTCTSGVLMCNQKFNFKYLYSTYTVFNSAQQIERPNTINKIEENFAISKYIFAKSSGVSLINLICVVAY